MSFTKAPKPAASLPDLCPTSRFPIACPECKAVAGMPIRAATCGDGGVIVDVRCRGCRHQWQCHLVAPAPVETRPKADRRGGS